MDNENEYNKTPLFYNNDIDVYKLLIKNGADINYKNRLGETPLFYVDDIEVCKLLINLGTNVNHTDINGYTPLFKCYNSFNKCKLLIDSGANVNHKNGYNILYLEVLCNRNYNPICQNKTIKYLLEETDVIVTSKAINVYRDNEFLFNHDIYNLLVSNEMISMTKSSNKI